LIKLRVKFSKKGRTCFISHLDLLRTFERSLRRANIPIAFSQGFNPHPKISFGSVLPVGLESEAEYVDFVLSEEYDSLRFKEILNQFLPTGLSVVAVEQVTPDAPSLMEEINLAVYRLIIDFELPVSKSELISDLEKFLAQEKIIITKKTKKGEKKINIRPLIKHLKLVATEQSTEKEWILTLAVYMGSKGSVRLDQLLVELNKFLPKIEYAKFLRTGLYIEKNNEIYCPLNKQLVKE